MGSTIIMPQLGETVAEGRILAWFKSVGDEIKEGENLFEVETDKVTIEVQAIVSGRLFEIRVQALSSLADGKVMSAGFHFNPFIGGSAILAAWIVVALLLRLTRQQLASVFRKTWQQMWGALLVGAFIFGLAFTYNYSGIAGSLAYAFAKLGTPFLVVAPILGFIGVALSGSNTSTNAMFGAFQAIVGRILGLPLLLLPVLNTVGAELGKPVAPQTASVGVATTRYVRNEGAVIRHNFAWTLALLAYLVVVGVACYLFFPGIMQLPAS